MQVQTAAGAISVDDLGATLMHEHLVIGFEGWESDSIAPDQTKAELVSRCVERIEQLKHAGFSSLLDPCPNDIGRDVELYAEVSARTGFNILFATGLYHEQWGAPYWRFKLGADAGGADYLAEVYIRELEDGVGPSRLKPAIIKLSIGVNTASEFEGKLLKAAAIASNATNTPILTHTEGVAGDIMMTRLKDMGVPSHRVIVGHSCGSPDHAYHRDIVDTGAYIGFDRFSMTKIQSDEVRTDSLHGLLEAGYAQSLIVSHDCVFCQRGRMLGPSSLARDPRHFSRNIAPVLRDRGVPSSALDSLFTDNPRRYFSDIAPARTSIALADMQQQRLD